MQTKRKRKQWALLAFTMIATLTLQLFAPVTAHAKETSESEIRSLTFKTSTMLYSEKLNTSYFTEYSYEVVGEGYFSVKCLSVEDADTTQFMATGYVCSDKPFSWRNQYNSTGWTDFVDASARNGIYYMPLLFGGSYASDWQYTWAGLVNNTHYTSKTEYDEAVETFFETMEVTKDSYKELVFDESTATYDANLDFASLGAKSNSAWTVSKGDDGYTLTTPSTAGVNIYWKNKQYVENSYVKIYFNGKYYKKFLDIKYVDGAISLSGEGASSSVEYDKIDRSSNSVFFLYNDILSECIKQNNYDGGYSFVIDNIQLQCYAEIDGIVKKSRIYKIDFNLLRENGTTDTVFNDASNVTYSTTDSVLGDFTTAYDDLEFVADIDVDKPIYEYDEVETNSFIKFFKWFYEMLQGITNSLGQFPQLLTSVFGFLPKEVTIIIGLALGAVVILRFLGR